MNFYNVLLKFVNVIYNMIITMDHSDIIVKGRIYE